MFLSSPLTSLLLVLPFLAHASASPISARTDALQWTTDWPERWCAGTEYELTWTGGSGIYELAGWINYPGLPDTHPGTFFRDSTQTSYNWTAFNPGSGSGNTFTFSIIDPENVDSSSSAWFSIGPELPLVVC